jgi:hypothetical protein
MRRSLAEGWGQFLSRFSWDWFLSLTFRDEVKSFRAHRLFGYFVRDLERAAGIPIFWFRADEIGSHGGRFHIHALIGNVGHLRRLSWMDRWNCLAGYARILPFEARKGAAYYCAKYVTKQSGDWDLSQNLEAFRQYQPVLPLSGPTRSAVSGAIVSAPIHSATSRRRFLTRGQYPLACVECLKDAVSDPVFEVYRSEVTRGRGRYKQFFIPGS